MKITLEKLEELGACSDVIDSFRASFPDGGAFRDVVERAIAIGAIDDAMWLAPRVLTKEDAVRYAVFAAREVLPIFEIKYPNDNRPRKAIESAEAWLANPCEETMNAVDAAADAAAAAAYAARAAEYAARAAEYAAAYAARAAADVAAYAAYAARAARDELKIKLLRHAVELVERTQNATNRKHQKRKEQNENHG